MQETSQLPKTAFCVSLASDVRVAWWPIKSFSVAKFTNAWEDASTGSQNTSTLEWCRSLGLDLYDLILAIKQPAAHVTLLTQSLNWSCVLSSLTFSPADLHISVINDICLEIFEHRSIISWGESSSVLVFLRRVQLSLISSPAEHTEYLSTNPGMAWQQSLCVIALI